MISCDICFFMNSGISLVKKGGLRDEKILTLDEEEEGVVVQHFLAEA